MRKRLQGYLAFLPGAYRLVMFVLLPLLVFAIPLLLQRGAFLAVTYFVAVILATGEIVMDFWAFGGIAMKQGLQLEYLKTSRRGMSMIQSALYGSLIRQLVEVFTLFVVCGLIFGSINGFSFWGDGNVWSYLCLMVAEYVCVVSAQFISRFFDGLWVYLLSAYVVSGLLLGASFLAKYHYAVTLPILAVIAVVVTVVSVKVIMWRVRASYYDKTA